MKKEQAKFKTKADSVIASWSAGGFIENLNKNLEEKQNAGMEIIDVKHTSFVAGNSIYDSALILYKEFY